MGMTSLEGCIKCQVNFYNDEPGQAGCQKCGPTSKSSGGATTCTCNGLGRYFVKSRGACLCAKGYKPKNNQPNIDSSDDCEADVKPVCAPGQLITIDGLCLKTAEDERLYCDSYCVGGGQVIAGTGMC